MGQHKKVIWALGFFGLTVILVYCFELYKKSEHGFNTKNLWEITEAIFRFKADHRSPPNNMMDLIPQYLSEMPKTRLIGYGHWNSSLVEYYSFLDSRGNADPKKLKDTGHWIYDSSTGKITIDCTHKCFAGFPYYDISRQLGLANTGMHFW